MANHKSAIKRIRQNETKRAQNRYHARTARSAVKELRASSDKEAARELLPKVSSMLDRMVKRNTIHKNKAANLKSELSKHVNSL
ncbi:MAG: 30S ribosomal protein S20 [Bacteroidales bacterium]|nr:30S ribosomal protein S20 [Bacteroidales bacterium]